MDFDFTPKFCAICYGDITFGCHYLHGKGLKVPSKSKIKTKVYSIKVCQECARGVRDWVIWTKDEPIGNERRGKANKLIKIVDEQQKQVFEK